MSILRKDKDKYKYNNILNVLFIYIVLTLIPLWLQNYPYLRFVGQGSILYTVYCNGIQFGLAIYLVYKKGKGFKLPIFWNLYLITFILCTTISFYIGSKLFNQGIFDFFNTMTSSLGIVVLIGAVYQLDEGDIKLNDFMKRIVYMVIILCIYNVLLNFRIVNFGYVLRNSSSEFASIFSNKNTFSSLLVIGIISCIFCINYRENNKIVYIIYLILMIVNLVWTKTMNSYISTIIFIIIFLWLYAGKNIAKKSMLFFVIIFSGTVLLSTGKFDGIIRFFTTGDLTEFSGRTELWKCAFGYIEKNLIFGISIGKSAIILKNSGFAVDQLHNAYIETLLSSGIVGIILHLIIIIKVISSLKNIYKVNRLYGSILSASFMSFICWGMFESWILFRNGYFGGIITIFYIVLPLIIHEKIKIERKING